MNAPVKPTIFTNVKREPLSQSPLREHRIGMRHTVISRHRNEELELLERLRIEAQLPSPLA